MPLILSPRHKIIDMSGTKIDHTGSTSETTMKTIVIPGNTLKTNGVLRISFICSHTNSANNKTYRFKYGGNMIAFGLYTTTATAQGAMLLYANNSTSAQKAYDSVIPFGATSAALRTMSVNSTIDQNFVITGQLANDAETMSIESYIIEAMA